MSGILKRRRTGVAWMMGVLPLVVFVAVAAHHAEWRRFAELLRSAQPAWLGAHDLRIEAALAATLLARLHLLASRGAGTCNCAARDDARDGERWADSRGGDAVTEPDTSRLAARPQRRF